MPSSVRAAQAKNRHLGGPTYRRVAVGGQPGQLGFGERTARQPGRNRDAPAHDRVAILQVRHEGVGVRTSQFDQVLHRLIRQLRVGHRLDDAVHIRAARRGQGERHGQAHLLVPLLREPLLDGHRVGIADPAEPSDAFIGDAAVRLAAREPLLLDEAGR